MKKKFKLGIIGCGDACTALVKSLTLSGYLSPKKIVVCDADEGKADALNDEFGVFSCNANNFVAENSEFLLFDTKAKNLPLIIKSFGGVVPEKVISVVTDFKKSALKEYFGGSGVKIARCVTGVLSTIGSGVIAIDMSDFNAEQDDTEFIYNIFNNLGTILSVDEQKLDVLSALSSSAAAFSFMFIDGLTDAGTKAGLTQDEAKLVASLTVMGSAEMVQRGEKELSELIVSASGKGASVLEGIKVLERDGFRNDVIKAVSSAIAREKGN